MATATRRIRMMVLATFGATALLSLSGCTISGGFGCGPAIRFTWDVFHHGGHWHRR